MKLLLHTCCAPCSTYVVDKLRKDGFDDITAYWYNINIHPFTEYKARLDAMKIYAEMINIPLVVNHNYGIREFTKAVIDNIDGRCIFCYESRLEETAKYAKENGYDKVVLPKGHYAIDTSVRNPILLSDGKDSWTQHRQGIAMQSGIEFDMTMETVRS